MSAVQTRDLLSAALKNRVGAIQQQVLQMIQNGSQAEDIGKLLGEGRRCEATLEKLPSFDDQTLKTVAEKTAALYGLTLPRNNRRADAPHQRGAVIYRRGIPSKSKLVVAAGTRFGSLTVLHELDPLSYGYYEDDRTIKVRRFAMRCDCGNETDVHLNNLRQGHTRSCGCGRTGGAL